MSKALDAALRLLARREYAALELKRRLLRDDYDPMAVDAALLTCQQAGYQSDERFSVLFCRTRIQQGYGPLKILQELKAHAIEKSYLDAFLQEEPVDWTEQAARVLSKHAWRFKDVHRVRKQTRFLFSRGFPSDVIQSVLNESRCDDENC